MSEYILQMENITKEFPGVTALSNVTFKVKRARYMPWLGKMEQVNLH